MVLFFLSQDGACCVTFLVSLQFGKKAEGSIHTGPQTKNRGNLFFFKGNFNNLISFNSLRCKCQNISNKYINKKDGYLWIRVVFCIVYKEKKEKKRLCSVFSVKLKQKYSELAANLVSPTVSHFITQIM